MKKNALTLAEKIGARLERNPVGTWTWLIVHGKREIACKRLTDVITALNEIAATV